MILLSLALAMGPDAHATERTRYVLSEASSGVDAQITETIKGAVTGMGFVSQRIATPLLRNYLTPCFELEVAVAPAEVVIDCDGRPPIRAPLDGGSAIWVSDTGRHFTVRAWQVDDGIALQIHGDHAIQTNRLRFDGQALELDKRIVSSRFAEDAHLVVRYTTGDGSSWSAMRPPPATGDSPDSGGITVPDAGRELGFQSGIGSWAGLSFSPM